MKRKNRKNKQKQRRQQLKVRRDKKRRASSRNQGPNRRASYDSLNQKMLRNSSLCRQTWLTFQINDEIITTTGNTQKIEADGFEDFDVLTDEPRQRLHSAMPIIVDEAVEEYEAILDTDFDWGSVRIAPPSKHWWMEWTSNGITYGVHCELYDTTDDKFSRLVSEAKRDCNRAIAMACFARIDSNYKHMHFKSYPMIYLNADGLICSGEAEGFRQSALADSSENMSLNGIKRLAAIQVCSNYSHFESGFVHRVLFSLALMSSKNTWIEKKAGKSSRSHRKNDLDDLSDNHVFKILKIDPLKKSKRYPKRVGQFGNSGKARHYVRAHFRYYKSGVSSYVRAHWRGSKAFGTVTKIYELKAGRKSSKHRKKAG